MAFRFAAAVRRATKLSRQAGLKRTRKAQAAATAMRRAINGAMVRTVMASIPALSPKSSGKPATAAKPRKAARKRAPSATPVMDRRLGTVLQQMRMARALMPGLGLPGGATSPAKPPAIPKGASFLERTHSCSAGARDYKLYLPANQPGGPKGLIVMLHGCTQDPNDFAVGTNMNAIAQKRGLAVAYPAQTRSHNAAACWNWFAPASQARGAGEPAIIAGLARALTKEFGLGRDAVFVAGLSAGGAMAEILLHAYPDVFSAAGVHSGLPRGSADSALSALAAMCNGETPKAPRRKVTVKADQITRRIIFHGDTDSTVHPGNAPRIVTGAVGTRKPSQVSPDTAGGRDYVRSDYALPDGTVDVEFWQIKGAEHAWSGGKSGGTYTDPTGPDASGEMVRFFLAATAD